MISEYEIKKQICDIAGRMYNNQMAFANAGNISVRLNQNEFLCTPAGISRGILSPEYICKIDREGNVIQGKNGYKPCSEMRMHMKVYEERSDVKAVIHAHPIYATTYAVAGIPLTQPIMPETVYAIGSVPITRYDVTCKGEQKEFSESIRYHDAVLLENHGALTCADTLSSAFQKMEALEFYAQVLFRSRELGGARELSTQMVDKLYELKEKSGMSKEHSEVELVRKVAREVMLQLGFPDKSHGKV